MSAEENEGLDEDRAAGETRGRDYGPSASPERSLRPTMMDVAAAAGVSQTTVSLVLNDASGARLSDSTRERVRAAVDELGYQFVARRGTRTRPAETRTIGFIADELSTDPWCVIALDGAQAKAWELGAEISVAITRGVPEREAAALAMLARQNIDALIYATIQTREVHPLPLPFEAQAVLLNCYRADKAWPSVVPDEFGGGYVATKRLIETGAQRIAHIHGQAWMDAASDRLRGYQRALREFGLEFDPLLVRPGNWEPAAGYEQTIALLDLKDPPTAIYCANDLMAVGCYEALKERGLRIPEDVSVVGYDDRDIALQMRPPLTTVLLPHYEMGARAAEIALAETNDRAVSVAVECPLIERDSALSPR